jgi:DNA-binding response OmpR family regulator
VNPAQGTVVVVEDDPHISELVELYLRKDGFSVRRATTGTEALELVRRERPRLVLLDVGLPGELDGFAVCRAIRSEGDTPVVFLTAQGDEIDRVLGLELGADDYVTKPFSPRELVARVKAVLRRESRPAAAPAAPLELGGVTVDSARREVLAGGERVELTTREFDLLVFLAVNRGFVLTRQQLLDGVWGRDWFGDERTVDVHVAQLRKKVGPELALATVRGVGYRLG